MLNGPEYLVAAGLEQFINMSMDYANPNPSRAQTRMRSQQFGSRLSIQSRLQSRKERLARTSNKNMRTILDEFDFRQTAEYAAVECLKNIP